MTSVVENEEKVNTIQPTFLCFSHLQHQLPSSNDSIQVIEFSRIESLRFSSHQQQKMEEPPSPPLITSQSLSVAPPPPPPPPSPPHSHPITSPPPPPPLSSSSSSPSSSHSPLMTPQSSSIVPPPPPSQPTSPPMKLQSLSIAPLPFSLSHSQPTLLINRNSNHQHEQGDSNEFLLHNGKKFEKSQVPMRIMFYLDNWWHDFKDEALESLRYGFVSGKTIVPLKIEGSMYAFDFLRMLQVHIDSKIYRSIAWIDEKGKPFFPTRFTDSGFSKIVAINDDNEKGNRKVQYDQELVVVAKQKSLTHASKFPNAKL